MLQYAEYVYGFPIFFQQNYLFNFFGGGLLGSIELREQLEKQVLLSRLSGNS